MSLQLTCESGLSSSHAVLFRSSWVLSVLSALEPVDRHLKHARKVCALRNEVLDRTNFGRPRRRCKPTPVPVAQWSMRRLQSVRAFRYCLREAEHLCEMQCTLNKARQSFDRWQRHGIPVTGWHKRSQRKPAPYRILQRRAHSCLSRAKVLY